MKARLMLVALLASMLALVGVVQAQEEGEDISGELEIFSWWAGNEGPALEALIDLYESEYPNVEVINATVTGGSGVNARAVLKTRMLGGDPPSTFQVHAGEELIGTWVVADRMEDISNLYEENNWMDVFPEEVIEGVTYEDGIYAVPITIHRSNVLWYRPSTMDEMGLEVPGSWDQFLEQCSTIEEAGMTPLAVGQAWTVNHLWESVALAELGAEGWNGIWTGETDPAGEEMIGVFEKFSQVLECTNLGDDASGLSWQQATDKVINGEAVYNVMGDWAAGYMTTTLELTPGEGFGYAAAPGTEGNFMWLSDSFGLPQEAPNREATIAWLETLGSVEGQNVFNPLKGSIPARLDAVEQAEGEYNQYLLDAADDFSNNTLVPSLAHGAAANERFMGEFGQVVEILRQTGSPEAAANALAAICAQSGACGSE